MMSIIRVSLRPAWRNYWFGILVAVCLLIVSLGLSISEADQGLGMGAEDVIEIDGVDHLVIQNVYRTGVFDYWCVELPE